MERIINQEQAEKSIRDFLVSMGEDVDREGLRETPKRFVNFYKEFLSPEDFKFTTFESEGYDQMIISKDIPFFSLCEHHLAPFFGTATIAYIPQNKKIVGISKLPRTLHKFAQRLQNQERITRQVAEYIEKKLEPKGVAVYIKARHLCQEMRGVKSHGLETITSEMKGVFRDELSTRNEFLNLMKS